MVYFIAEAGINHNGNIDTAKQMIDVAKSAGADCVKFQYFHENEVREVWDKIKGYCLDLHDVLALRDYCYNSNIDFLCSAFGINSLLGLCKISDSVKIPSGKITDKDYLKFIADSFTNVIISTGMADKNEIRAAHDIIPFASILHCVSAYPPPDDECNLGAIKTLNKLYPFNKIGFSNHSENYILDMMAVAAGAKIIEKHFTLDKGMEGQDHSMSLTPERLVWNIAEIRKAEAVMGNGELKCEECEKDLLFRRTKNES
jgi:sialic acid synthase SpsE